MIRLLRLLLVLPLLAGCSSDSDNQAGPGDGDGNGDGTGIVTDLTDPAEVVATHARTLEERLYAPYMALLEVDPGGTPAPASPPDNSTLGFRFYVRDDDADRFPWAAGGSWGLIEEAGFVAGMFDPNFWGENPPVESIDFDFTVLAHEDLGGGLQGITVDAIIQVLTAPTDGWRADTRFIITMATQADGFLRIRGIAEVQKLEPGPGATASAEEQSWGQIKSLYK